MTCPEDFLDSLKASESVTRESPARDFLTFLALSFHAIFEGMGLGLEESSEDVWVLFAG